MQSKQIWHRYPDETPDKADIYTHFLVAYKNPHYIHAKFKGDISGSVNVPEYYAETAEWLGDSWLTKQKVEAWMKIPAIILGE